MYKRQPKHSAWPNEFEPEKYNWSEFLDSKKTALEALKTFVTFGVIILKNAPQESNSLELLAKRLGPINEVLFERIHNVSVTGHIYNVAHTPKGLLLIMTLPVITHNQAFRFCIC